MERIERIFFRSRNAECSGTRAALDPTYDCVAERPWSSFHRYVKMGLYEAGWGDEIGEELKEMECGE